MHDAEGAEELEDHHKVRSWAIQATVLYSASECSYMSIIPIFGLHPPPGVRRLLVLDFSLAYRLTGRSARIADTCPSNMYLGMTTEALPPTRWTVPAHATQMVCQRI
jgi:hypothetical protein